MTSPSTKKDFIFGIRPVLEAIAAGKTVDKIFVQNGLHSPTIIELKELLRKNHIHANYVPVEKLNRFTRKNHQGVVAFISDIPFYKVADVVADVFEQGRMPFFLMLDGVTDVRNFGAIARTAECVGVDAIIIPEKGASPVNSDAIKTSAGALYNIKVCKVPDLKMTADYLQKSGLQISAASEKATDLLYKTDFRVPVCVVMGSEDTGVSPDILKICNEKIRLPMSGKTQSLNVSVACGAILYEVVRQRLDQK